MNKILASAVLAFSVAAAPFAVAQEARDANAAAAAAAAATQAKGQMYGQPKPGTVQWYLTPNSALIEGNEPGLEPIHNHD